MTNISDAAFKVKACKTEDVTKLPPSPGAVVYNKADGKMYFCDSEGWKVVGGFTDEYQAVYDSFTTKPSEAVAAAQNTMVSYWVSTGVWALRDIIYVFAAHTNDDSEALINWKNPGTYDATIVGSLTFTAFEGFTGAGGYMRTHYQPATHGVNFTQSSGSVGLYVRTGSATSAHDFMANNPYTGVKCASDSAFEGINSTALKSIQNTGGTGFFIANRVDAIESKSIYNSLYNIYADVPASTTDLELFLFTRNKVGSPELARSDRQYSHGWVGAGMTDMQVFDSEYGFETYMDSNSKGVVSDDTLTLQSYVNNGTTIPAGSYEIDNSIKVESVTALSFESGVVVTCSDNFYDSGWENVGSKNRHAAFLVTNNDVTVDFNDCVIDCNQDTLLSSGYFLSCIFFKNCSNAKVENLEGNNTHNSVLAFTVTTIEANNIDISSLSAISNDDYKNAALDVQFCSGITGAGFTGDGCEEVVDLNDGNQNITISNIYGANTTQNVLEINDSKNIIIDNITGLNLNANILVKIQEYTGVPWQNQNITLTNMQDNVDYSEAGVVTDRDFLITP